MKLIIGWVLGCLILGVGGGYFYLNRPSAVEARTETTLANATPKPSAKLESKSFTNGGHKFTLQFFSDALVTTGKLATSAGQQAVLARPGRTATSYVMFAGPISNTDDSLRSDCGTREPTAVEFKVNLYGNEVSVCHGSSTPYAVYTMDVRATGTWEQITLFDNGLASLTPSDAQLKTILGSLVIN